MTKPSPHTLRSVRRLSDDHRVRLRALMARAGSATAAARELRSCPEVVLNAISGATFRICKADALEATIDGLEDGAP